MPTIACPKCQKKFKLSTEMLGKTLRCSSCKTAFKTAAQSDAAGSGAGGKKRSRKSAAAGAPTQGSETSLADVGLSGPLQGGPDIFSSAKPPSGNHDPLGNFALEDPGFANIDSSEAQPQTSQRSAPSGKEHLLHNPALQGRAINPYAGSKSKATGSKGIAKQGHQGVKVLGIITSLLMFFGSLGFVSIGLFNTLIALELMDAGTAVIPLLISFGLGFGLFVLGFILALVFWPLAHSHTSTMGAKGHSFTAKWMVFGWFIPLVNLYVPLTCMNEIYQASVRPQGTKWKNVPKPWEPTAWLILTVAGGIIGRVSDLQGDDEGSSLLLSLLFLTLAISTGLHGWMIRKVARAQNPKK